MRSILPLGLLILALGTPPLVAQEARPVVSIDLVKAKPGQRDRLIRFFEVNWAAARRTAVAQGAISGYRLLVNSDTGGRWDVALETDYPDSAAFLAREEIFRPILAAKGRILIDGLDRPALGDIVESADVVLRDSEETLRADEPRPATWVRINQYCHPPENCTLRGRVAWDTANAAPRYAEVLRAVGIEGEVLVRFGVRADGTVDPASIRILQSSNQAFEAAVREAASRWRFRIETSDAITAPLPTEMGVLFAFADRCAGVQVAATAFVDIGERPRLIVLACLNRLIPRD